ncbi:Beta-galactosidase [Acidisarcina polymorpha]|uniref:Beta-galactosidase n=1 Tax=Acidisarcina polymorpha TaxID=2211140 RepID=A0A2Z5G3F8_9BACT|nr:sugar-binding domain-containing protein [Acidisarcina polymorpha]AXC13642.1 Beta-galactosidase [Acidisarcina polymorpha]
MKMDKGLTRREAMQGLLGAALIAATPLSAYTEQKQKGTTAWPAEAVRNLPRPQPLNEGWRFHRGELEGASAGDFSDASWRTVTVPHDWSIEDGVAQPQSMPGTVWALGDKPVRVGPFDMYESAGQTATGWTVGGVGWYRRTFEMPEVPAGGKVELQFEGVYMNSDVWINGAHLGNHPYGYTEFAYDLTQHLKPGKNTIAVKVNNAGRNSRWYSGSGIFRKVWLRMKGELSIPEYGVFVWTQSATADAAQIKVESTVENRASTPRKVRVAVRLVDDQGVPSASSTQGMTIPANASAVASLPLQVQHPRLWSSERPQLYRVEVVVEDGTKVVDAASVSTGIRTVEIDAAHGLRINGENVKLRGGCVHNDNGPIGTACIPRAEERRLEILKANGYNAVRTSHAPPSRNFLDACDRLGMLVIDEAFDGWEQEKNPDDYHLFFNEWSHRDLENMILRDRNHPCVILWSIGNEMKERAEPRGVEIGKGLAAVAHKVDPTRRVTAAICEPYDHPKQTWEDMQPAFTYLDVAGYNYRLDKYESDHAKYPDRVMVGTESYPGAVYQIWDFIERSSWVIGDFVWTAADYMGESGLGFTALRNGPGRAAGLQGYPWFNSYCGDIDLIGNKKPQSYFRDIVWRRSKIEMAVQRPIPAGWSERLGDWSWSDELRSWSWYGFEGTPLKVRVYTRATRVKLLLNGKEIGTQELKPSDGLKTEFAVPYSPGELKAIAYEGDIETSSIAFATTGQPHHLVLTPDRRRLITDGDDLGYVMVTVVDEAGRPVPDAVVPVSFTVEGAGELMAVGNANPKDVTSFQQPHRDTYHGVCLAVVRPRGAAGKIVIRAQSPGLQGGTAELESASS